MISWINFAMGIRTKKRQTCMLFLVSFLISIGYAFTHHCHFFKLN